MVHGGACDCTVGRLTLLSLDDRAAEKRGGARDERAAVGRYRPEEARLGFEMPPLKTGFIGASILLVMIGVVLLALFPPPPSSAARSSRLAHQSRFRIRRRRRPRTVSAANTNAS